MPEETKAAPLAPILTPGKREGEGEGEAREKLLGRTREVAIALPTRPPFSEKRVWMLPPLRCPSPGFLDFDSGKIFSVPI